MLESAKSMLKGLIALSGYELARRRDGSDTQQAAKPFGEDRFADIHLLLGNRSPRVGFDVGANRGQTALEFVQHFPDAQIYCFEPYEVAFEELKRSMAPFPMIEPHRLALGDGDSVGTLHLNRISDTNSLLPNSPSAADFSPEGWTDPVGSAEVPVRRLDSFCRERGITSIDLLKIDTQGFELRVLRGAGEMLDPSIIRLIYLEVNFVSLYEGQAYFEDVYAMLKLHGYRFVEFYNKVLARDNSLMWADALFQ